MKKNQKNTVNSVSKKEKLYDWDTTELFIERRLLNGNTNFSYAIAAVVYIL